MCTLSCRGGATLVTFKNFSSRLDVISLNFLLAPLLAGVIPLSLGFQPSRRRTSRLSRRPLRPGPLQTELTAFKYGLASYHESAVMGIFTDSHTDDVVAAAAVLVSVQLV